MKLRAFLKLLFPPVKLLTNKEKIRINKTVKNKGMKSKKRFSFARVIKRNSVLKLKDHHKNKYSIADYNIFTTAL